MEIIYIVIAVVIAGSAGYAAALMIQGSRIKKAMSDSATQLEVLRERFAGKENQLAELNTRFEKVECSLNEKMTELSKINALKASLEQQALRVPILEEDRTKKEEKILNLQTLLSKFETRLEEEQKQSEEKIALLNDAKEHQKVVFQNLANSIFEEKSRMFIDKNKAGLEHVLAPLRDQIGDFRKKVEDVYDKETRERVSLFNEITHLKDLNLRISKEALDLTHALKGDSKTQGAWGEIVLERVLEESGLKKGREYDIQVSLKDDKGKLFKPDVIVRLPEEKDVIIDSKVSLTAYERYCSSDTDNDKAVALKEHILSIQTHIKGLSLKNYCDLQGVRSLDFILMFVPIEAAFHLAVEHDKKLFGEAFERNILVVSPTTLLVTLRTIQNIWRYEYQNQNALQIAKRAGDLYDKFVGFIHALEEVGNHLDKAKKSYNEAHNRLTSGKGNLIKRTHELKDLGLKTKKKISKQLIEQADVNDESKQIPL